MNMMNEKPGHKGLPTAPRRGWRTRLAGGATERGSATIFVVGFAIVLFAGAGLAIDGGRAINARDKATDVAEQAARAGADQLNQSALRNSGEIVLDQDSARARADSFVAAAGYTPTTATTATSVTVRASATYRTALLGIVGINTIDVSGIATASPTTGATP
jgi:Flp pilus assembly protein TadG